MSFDKIYREILLHWTRAWDWLAYTLRDSPYLVLVVLVVVVLIGLFLRPKFGGK